MRIPDAARQEIETLLIDPGLNSDERTLLETLRSDRDELTVKVWPELSDKARGQEGTAVRVVFAAFRESYGYRGPMPNRRDPVAISAWCHGITKNAVPSAGELAFLARWLAEGMLRAGLELGPAFDQILQGGHTLKFSCVVEVVNRAANCLEAIDNAAKLTPADGFVSVKLPRKLNHSNAREVHFSRVLSNYFDSLFGRKMDSAVTALTQVIFGGHPTDEPLARSRRRVAHSGRKTQ